MGRLLRAGRGVASARARTTARQGDACPHNSVYVLLGAGRAWFGWFGFNGGSGIEAGTRACCVRQARRSTPAARWPTWFVLDLPRSRQVTVIGAATAIVVGCVAITPAGGFVSPIWGDGRRRARRVSPAHAVIMWRPRTRVDETLDVLAAHGVAGLTGILFIGLVAQVSWNGVADGSALRRPRQFGEQAPAPSPRPTCSATFGLLK